MNEQEEGLAGRIAEAIQAFTVGTDRSKQAREFKVGISDLGYCSERTRRMLDQQVPEDSDMFKAFLGTAIGDHVEQAVIDHYPGRVIRQAEVVITLEGEERVYEVPGHPDLILPDEGILLDAKTSDGLALARRLGADQQKNFQRHGYGLGAWRAGLFGDIPLEEIQVGNVWIDRSGEESQVHVELVPFDMDVIREAARWLDDVVYAYLREEEAQKEPAREVCAKTCGFFEVCRQWDTDVSGLLTDEEVVTAVDMYVEGSALEKQGKSLKAQAKAALVDVSGSTGTHTVRWTWINPVLVPETSRRGYSKIDVRAIRRRTK